jgi:hypothetical protein
MGDVTNDMKTLMGFHRNLALRWIAIPLLLVAVMIAFANNVKADHVAEEGCGVPVIDVWDSTDPENYDLIGQIETIRTAQTGKMQYSFTSWSGHPSDVNLALDHANLWMHQSTLSNDLTFGFIFGQDDSGSLTNTSSANFRIVGSDTGPLVV